MNNEEINNLESGDVINFDINIIKKISEVQELPEEVVKNFLRCSGSLAKTNFESRNKINGQSSQISN
ncbi:MAG: hypothetical protein WAU11_01455 [Ignavibacteriaceae bacterium]